MATRAWNPDIAPVEVRADSDYQLHIRFNDGLSAVYDVAPLLEKGIFQRLRDISFFKQAHIAYNTVVWDDVLDIAPEALYEDSVPVTSRGLQ
jgi:hypothetical protein